MKILVVDDNVDSAESLALLLSLGGHETHVAHDGVTALESAARHVPDVVLLDIGLPRMDGLEVCRRLREQPWGRTMGLIALTGWGQEEDRDETSRAGFDRHLVKPVDVEVLLKMLDGMPRQARS